MYVSIVNLILIYWINIIYFIFFINIVIYIHIYIYIYCVLINHKDIISSIICEILYCPSFIKHTRLLYFQIVLSYFAFAFAAENLAFLSWNSDNWFWKPVPRRYLHDVVVIQEYSQSIHRLFLEYSQGIPRVFPEYSQSIHRVFLEYS